MSSAGSSSSEHDRTEPASPFKLKEARHQGQVAKSMEMVSFFMVFAFLTALLLAGQSVWMGLLQVASNTLQSAKGSAAPEFAVTSLVTMASVYWHLIIGLVCTGFVAAVAGNWIQTGPLFSGAPLKPKFERISPVAGFKRIYSKRMLLDLVKNILKLVLLIAVTYLTFSTRWQELTELAAKRLPDQVYWLASICITLLVRLLAVLFVIALLDMALTRWQFSRQMRMSRRDVKEEIKRREGDPLVKSKIRQLQRENLKQAKSLARVPEADVLITNPTHFAIALKYVRGQMTAPVVIAKGRDRWAHDMRVVAAHHKIPVFERRQLAKLLFRHGHLDQPIPADSFVDVARVYAEVASYKRRLQGVGQLTVSP